MVAVKVSVPHKTVFDYAAVAYDESDSEPG